MTNTIDKVIHNGDEYMLPRQKALVITLTSAWWTNNEQTVTATGVTANNSIIISPVPTDISDYADAKIYCSAQGTDSLTFTCDTAPSNDIEVNVLVLSAEVWSTPTPPSPWRQPWVNTLVYYNIDDNDTTTTIYDKSWNNYDATWSSTGSYIVDSDAGRVAYFNWEYADTWAVINFGNNFTFNVWINQTVAPSWYGYQSIFGEWASSSTLPSVWMDFRDGSTKLFGFADWTGNWIILNVSTTADLNTWMLLSMVLDNWTLTIYKNWVSLGNLANVPNPTYNISWWATFALSRWRNWDLNPFYWYIKEFIGEDKARTSQEIQDYFDQTKGNYWIS